MAGYVARRTGRGVRGTSRRAGCAGGRRPYRTLVATPTAIEPEEARRLAALVGVDLQDVVDTALHGELMDTGGLYDQVLWVVGPDASDAASIPASAAHRRMRPGGSLAVLGRGRPGWGASPNRLRQWCGRLGAAGFVQLRRYLVFPGVVRPQFLVSDRNGVIAFFLEELATSRRRRRERLLLWLARLGRPASVPLMRLFAPAWLVSGRRQTTTTA